MIAQLSQVVFEIIVAIAMPPRLSRRPAGGRAIAGRRRMLVGPAGAALAAERCCGCGPSDEVEAAAAGTTWLLRLLPGRLAAAAAGGEFTASLFRALRAAATRLPSSAWLAPISAAAAGGYARQAPRPRHPGPAEMSHVRFIADPR